MLAEVLEANGDYQGANQAYLTCVLIDPENNKEAAARMKQMQTGQVAVPQTLGTPPSREQQAALQQQAAREQQAALQQQSAREQQAAASPQVPTKDMYEGAPTAAASATPNAMGFRTHEEPSAAPSQPAAASAAEANVENSAVIDGMSQVTEAESQKNYTAAIDLLRQLVSKNLQNAEVHHRLAVNLLADGQITEAIAEFRIASALSPTKRAYSEDLARAMAIHKRSMMSESGTQEESGTDSGATAGAN
jgi:tetratricopeptide (TPR) repeat protein